MTLTPADRPSPAVPPAEGPPGKAGPEDAGPAYVRLLILAQFGVFMALVTPIAISLAIRVEQLAPDHEEYLGYIIGTGGLTTVVAAPLVGMLSDRTRSRLGRRSPYLIAATAVGVAALPVLALAPSVPVLGLGWVLAQLGWGTVLPLLLASQADRLPEAQRGKVSGLAGVVQQLAPVAGALMGGAFAGSNLLLFLVPGTIGAVSMVLFVALVREPDSRGRGDDLPPITAASLARTYVFDPRQNPDFAWNWLGKFLFMVGLTFNTTFTAFFLADRMGVRVEEVSGTIAVLAGGGIFATMLGALGGGLLSDRLRRRRIFVLAGGGVFALGVTVMALAPGMPLIIAGAILGNFGLGVFAAVDQALMLDVLPDRETDAGRFAGIYNFSTTIAQGLAPLIAPALLAVGAADGERNYTLLYLVAAAFTLLGGLVVATRITSVR
ncbi:Na+/melibiose symporter-like transporter [Actinocorallia herbida]|uniref:Na+/melibiose symporter-like transporter n=1 Tax=Actinocorallia herbida TaxID=58109 RepID=A0A3N1D1E4_9ACTN|nr:MFS transporter [Actinocorallia herbida]ROO87336.1 Na+/melibiose symporter-like transporter [Actinocorallia herbida]